MVDLNKDIAEILAPAGKVELEFPDIKTATFPCISIVEVDNSEKYRAEGVEYTSDIVYQVDVWDKPQAQVRYKLDGDTELDEEVPLSTPEVIFMAIVQDVDTRMQAAGFRRVASRGLKEPSGLLRKMLQYRVIVLNN